MLLLLHPNQNSHIRGDFEIPYQKVESSGHGFLCALSFQARYWFILDLRHVGKGFHKFWIGNYHLPSIRECSEDLEAIPEHRAGRWSCHFSPSSPWLEHLDVSSGYHGFVCLETAAEMPKCVISHRALPCTQLHTHSLEGTKETAMMALSLLDWPILPATKRKTIQRCFSGHFPGLTNGKAMQKVLHSWLYCQLEHQWPQAVGPKEVLLSVNQLQVKIICFSRELLAPSLSTHLQHQPEALCSY